MLHVGLGNLAFLLLPGIAFEWNDNIMHFKSLIFKQCLVIFKVFSKCLQEIYYL